MPPAHVLRAALRAPARCSCTHTRVSTPRSTSSTTSVSGPRARAAMIDTPQPAPRRQGLYRLRGRVRPPHRADLRQLGTCALVVHASALRAVPTIGPMMRAAAHRRWLSLHRRAPADLVVRQSANERAAAAAAACCARARAVRWALARAADARHTQLCSRFAGAGWPGASRRPTSRTGE